MKLIDREEKQVHANYVAVAGFKGFVYGSILSVGLFNYLRLKHPTKFASFNTSIKTCVLILPTIATVAYFSDHGSVAFDQMMYSRNGKAAIMEEYREWKKKSTLNKAVAIIQKNKLCTYVSGILLGVLGSWAYSVNANGLSQVQRQIRFRNGSIVSSVLVTALCTPLLLEKGEKSFDPLRS